jgi:predicted methyltransferase
MKIASLPPLTAVAMTLLACGALLPSAARADRYDAAVAHTGRSKADLERDPLDHAADMLRLTGMQPGMRVADVLAGDGYFSELASYVVGPGGKVLLINNQAFDKWSEEGLTPRIAGNRLPNVEHETLDLGDLKLPPAGVDVVLLVKVYHDMYWVDPKGEWPRVDVGRVLDQLAAALKPDGVLLLIDHSARAGRGKDDAGALHRVEQSFAIQDFEAHGFKVARQSEVLRKPGDRRDQISYKGPMLGKTDRFVVLFKKA